MNYKDYLKKQSLKFLKEILTFEKDSVKIEMIKSVIKRKEHRKSKPRKPKKIKVYSPNIDKVLPKSNWL